MDWHGIATGRAGALETLTDEPLIAAMSRCPQTPRHHREGDVATHIDMALDAVDDVLGNAGIDGTDAELVRLAVALHDIGKPAVTVEVAPCEWSAPRHAEVGAEGVNTLYDTHPQLRVRGTAEAVAVAAAVRAHMWAWHPENVSAGAAIRTAHLVDPALLAALWAADGAGRISDDSDEIPERLEWARAVIDSHTGGGASPYPHISEVCDPLELEPRVRRGVLRGVVEGRITNAGAAAAAIAAAERHSNGAKIVWTLGVPGAGKSTWSRRYAEANDAEVLTVSGARRRDRDLSRGHNRAELERIVAAGGHVVVDATHVTRESRDRIIALAGRYGATLDAVAFECPTATAIARQRNRERGAAVPADVIRSMAAKRRWPTPDEYDTLTVIATDGTSREFRAAHQLRGADR